MWKRAAELPLSLRLTAVYVGLVAVLLVADGAILYVETREFLLDSTAIRMRDTAVPQIEDWAEDRLSGSDIAADLRTHAGALSDDLTSTDTSATVLDPDGGIVSGEPPPGDVGSEQLARALGGSEVTYRVDGDDPHLVVLLPLRASEDDGERVVGVVRLSSPLAGMQAILGRELIGIVVVVVITVSLVGLGGYVLTRRALRPLRRVIETSRHIAAGDLSQRVTLPARRDEVGEVGTAFNEMAARIEAAFDVQSRFIRDAAHELRTPLTAMKGAMEVLLRGSLDDPADARQLQRAMYHDIVRLSELTEHLLDTARLGTAIPLHRQDLDVTSFLMEQARNARLLAPEHQVTLVGEADATVSADERMLGQAVLNLLENAARHSPPGSVIELGRGLADGEAQIWVTDRGEGISADDMPNIFQSFYRSDPSRSRQRGGAGLGLALVDAIVAAHGGTVSVESTVGSGSTFTIRLPAVRTARVAAAPAERADERVADAGSVRAW